jgi:hypothetical protein
MVSGTFTSGETVYGVLDSDSIHCWLGHGAIYYVFNHTRVCRVIEFYIRADFERHFRLSRKPSVWIHRNET